MAVCLRDLANGSESTFILRGYFVFFGGNERKLRGKQQSSLVLQSGDWGDFREIAV